MRPIPEPTWPQFSKECLDLVYRYRPPAGQAQATTQPPMQPQMQWPMLSGYWSGPSQPYWGPPGQQPHASWQTTPPAPPATQHATETQVPQPPAPAPPHTAVATSPWPQTTTTTTTPVTGTSVFTLASTNTNGGMGANVQHNSWHCPHGHSASDNCLPKWLCGHVPLFNPDLQTWRA